MALIHLIAHSVDLHSCLAIMGCGDTSVVGSIFTRSSCVFVCADHGGIKESHSNGNLTLLFAVMIIVQCVGGAIRHLTLRCPRLCKRLITAMMVMRVAIGDDRGLNDDGCGDLLGQRLHPLQLYILSTFCLSFTFCPCSRRKEKRRQMRRVRDKVDVQECYKYPIAVAYKY